MLSLAIAAALTAGQGVPDPQLSSLCSSACEATVSEFGTKGLKPEFIAAGIAVLDPATHTFQFGSVRGTQPFYPASVVKLFYLAYAADCFAHNRVKRTEELDR